MPSEVLELKQERMTALEEIALKRTLISQKKVQERHETRGEPYQVGDRVRIKLSISERERRGGKKMAPLYSDCYVVNDNCYKNVPTGGHFLCIFPSQ